MSTESGAQRDRKAKQWVEQQTDLGLLRRAYKKAPNDEIKAVISSRAEVLKGGQTQAANKPVKETAAQRWDRESIVRETDDLLTAIAKLGGLNTDEAISEGIDPAHKAKRGLGIRRVLNKKGRSLDDLREALEQEHFDFGGDKNTFLERVTTALDTDVKDYGEGDVTDTVDDMVNEHYAQMEEQERQQAEQVEPAPTRQAPVAPANFSAKPVERDNFPMNFPTRNEANLRPDVPKVGMIKELMPTGDRTGTTRGAGSMLPKGSTFTVQGIPGTYEVTGHEHTSTMTPEDWSKREGWSEQYYNDNPRLHDMWQMGFTRVDEAQTQSTPEPQGISQTEQEYIDGLATPGQLKRAAAKAKRKGREDLTEALRKRYADIRKTKKEIKPKPKPKPEIKSDSANPKANIPVGQNIEDTARRVDEFIESGSIRDLQDKHNRKLGRLDRGEVKAAHLRKQVKAEATALEAEIHRRGGKTYKEINAMRKEAKPEGMQSLANKMSNRVLGKDFGIDIVNDKRARELALENDIKDYDRKVREGVIHAFASTKKTKEGKYEVFVNPNIDSKAKEEILAHEIGHAIFAETWETANPNQIKAVEREFAKWLKKHGKSTANLEKLIKSKKGEQAAMLYLQKAAKNAKYGDLTEAQQEYAADFEEWFADEVSKSLTRPEAKTAVHRFFRNITTQLKRLFGKDSVGAYVESLKANQASNPALKQSVVKFSENLASTPKVKSAMDKFLDVVLDKDSRLRALAKENKIPAFTKLADLMHKKIGDKVSDNSYWGARLRENGRYQTRWQDILDRIPETKRAQVLQELYTDSNNVSADTRRVRKLFRELADYLGKSGVDMDKSFRKNYFPNIINVDKLQGRQTQFMDMMENYPEEMSSLAETRTKQAAMEYLTVQGEKVTRASIDKAIRDGSVETVTAEDMPLSLYRQLVETKGVADKTVSGQQTPGTRFLNTRIFDFLEGPDQKVWNEEYLQQDLNSAVVPYISQITKRAEFERRFSTDKLSNILETARTQGATHDQIQQAYDNVGAEMGTYGRKTAQWLHDVSGGLISMPKAKSPINPVLQAVQNTLITASNAMVLGLSAITSIVDPVGIAVRTGELDIAVKALKEGLKNTFKGQSDVQKLAKQLGAIGNDSVNQVLQQGYSTAYMGNRMRKFNDVMFTAFGLETWTKATRLMGTAASKLFIEKHMAAMNTSSKSKRYMSELGLKEGDVKGEVKLLTYDQYQKASPVEQAKDDRIRAAMSEFIDTAVLRPTPSQRPLYASDPHWAWFFHLKSFAYSFQKTILNRIYHNAQQGDMSSLHMASLYLPVAFVGQLMKDVIKTATDDEDDWTPDYKENWGFFDYLEDTFNKAGLYGIAQPIRDIAQERGMGGSGVMALPGPSIDPETYTKLPIPLNYLFR